MIAAAAGKASPMITAECTRTVWRRWLQSCCAASRENSGRTAVAIAVALIAANTDASLVPYASADTLPEPSEPATA